jgi:hypothetical protein
VSRGFQALKGRHKALLVGRLLRPFRAGEPRWALVPRALPWADLLRPLRGKVDELFGMVQTEVTTPSPNSVGNALRGVPLPMWHTSRNRMARRTRNGTESVPYRTTAGFLPETSVNWTMPEKELIQRPKYLSHNGLRF